MHVYPFKHKGHGSTILNISSSPFKFCSGAPIYPEVEERESLGALTRERFNGILVVLFLH